MERNFTVFESGMLLPEASSELQRLPQSYAVIIDEVSQPLGLVDSRDLEQALNMSSEVGTERTLAEAGVWLPPLLTLPEGVRLRRTAPTFKVPQIARAARGVVVLNENGIVGVLPQQSIPAYVRSMGAGTGLRTFSGVSGASSGTGGLRLAGKTDTPPARVVCCLCNTRNSLHVQVYPLPWCRNDTRPVPGPHRIDLSCLKPEE